MKRAFDFLLSLIGIIVLSPVFVIIIILTKVTSKGPAFYKQVRIGRNNKEFKLYKFRSMYVDAASKGLLTIGSRDSRITGFGYYLRKYKLDELPQLINVLIGDMSLVGPRPEVKKYVDMYNEQQLGVLAVKPGITDWASIKFRNENEILSQYENPEEAYINNIMCQKLDLNLEYIKKRSIYLDVKIIWLTIKAIIKV